MPFQVDVDDGVELVLGHVERHRVPEDAGAVRDAVDRPVLVDGVRDQPFRVPGVGDVAEVRHRLAQSTTRPAHDLHRIVEQCAATAGAAVLPRAFERDRPERYPTGPCEGICESKTP